MNIRKTLYYNRQNDTCPDDKRERWPLRRAEDVDVFFDARVITDNADKAI